MRLSKLCIVYGVVYSFEFYRELLESDCGDRAVITGVYHRHYTVSSESARYRLLAPAGRTRGRGPLRLRQSPSGALAAVFRPLWSCQQFG